MNQPFDVSKVAPAFDVEAIRRDFPILSERPYGRSWSISTTPPRRKSRGR